MFYKIHRLATLVLFYQILVQNVMSCHGLLCHIMTLCHVVSCHVELCHVELCHVVSCHITSHHVTSYLNNTIQVRDHDAFEITYMKENLPSQLFSE